MQSSPSIHSFEDYRDRRDGGGPGDAPLRQEFEFNDIGTAKRFVKMFGDRVRFIADINEWFFFQRTAETGGRWMRDNIGETDRYMKLMAAAILEEEEPASWPKGPNAPEFWKERNGFYDRIVGATRSNRLASIKTLVKSELPIPEQQASFDKNIWLLNLVNGTYDLEKMEFRPASSADLIMKQVPVVFDPEATLHYSPECELCRDGEETAEHRISTWLRALYIYFQNYPPEERDELIKFLQRLLGYTLCGATSERFLFILQGKPDAGKSTIIKTMQRLLADYAARVPIDSLMESKVRDGERATPMLMRLMGARFVSALESDESSKLGEGRIKELVGGDRLIGRDMHARGRGVEFEPTHKLVIGTNYMPKVEDPIVWRKIKRIQFNHSIPKSEQMPKEQLEAAIEAEFPGLLNWLLEGFRAWKQNGLGSCKAIDEATTAAQIEQDYLADFLAAERWQRSGMITKVEFHVLFNVWAERELGWKKEISLHKLGSLMKARDFEEDNTRINGKKTRVWLNISRKDADELKADRPIATPAESGGNDDDLPF